MKKRDIGENPKNPEEDMKMQFFIETEKALGAYDKTLGIEYAKHIPKSWQNNRMDSPAPVFLMIIEKRSTESGEKK